MVGFERLNKWVLVARSGTPGEAGAHQIGFSEQGSTPHQADVLEAQYTERRNSQVLNVRFDERVRN